MHIGIRAIGAYEPTTILTNDDLAATVDTSDAWIRSHTGIESRHVATKETSSSAMAVLAVRNLLADTGLRPSEIGGIVVATATPDYPGFPSTACIVAEALGCSDIPAFDIGAGCSGFIYAIETARALMTMSDIRRFVVIGTEKLSSILDWDDRSTCVLFGDGAGCVLLEGNTQEGIVDGILGATGDGSKALTVHPDRKTIEMDGHAVYSFAVRAIGETIATLLDRNGLTMDDIDYIVPHQANRRIIASCAKRYAIPLGRFFLDIDTHANTSAASIPLALKDMQDRKLLHEGQRILLIGFGAGLTYGGILLKWQIS